MPLLNRHLQHLGFIYTAAKAKAKATSLPTSYVVPNLFYLYCSDSKIKEKIRFRSSINEPLGSFYSLIHKNLAKCIQISICFTSIPFLLLLYTKTIRTGCAVGLPGALVLGRPDLPCLRTLRLLGHPSVRASRLWRLRQDVPIHLQTDLPQGMYPYIFRQVYLKVGTLTSSDQSTSRYVPYIFRQIYLKVCTHNIFRQVYLKVGTLTSSDQSTSRYVPIHLQTGLPQGMYPYIFRLVYPKVCTLTSSDQSTSRYVPSHLQTDLPQGMHPHIFRQIYLKVCTHTSSDRSTSRNASIHLQTGFLQCMCRTRSTDYLREEPACLKPPSFTFCLVIDLYLIFASLSVRRSRSLLHRGTSSSGSDGRRAESNSYL